MNLTIASLFKVEILKNVQILVVDNDLDSGVLYTLFFKHFGANVIATGSIKEALKTLTWFVPHIVICEIRFLGESICTLLDKLTALEADNRNHIPIIVTSTSATSTIEQIFKIEIAGYLIKPIDLDKLVVMIENLVPTREVNILGKNSYKLIQKIRILLSPKKKKNSRDRFDWQC
ncbi:response regulator [Nostoc linckia FACHB-104]|nr:response regulator [Nostoc linckia FACHB-104]